MSRNLTSARGNWESGIAKKRIRKEESAWLEKHRMDTVREDQRKKFADEERENI